MRTKRFHVLMAAAAIAAAEALAGTPARVVQTVDGDDWSLPAHVRMAPWSGWIGWSSLSWAQKRAKLPQYQDGGIHLGVCVTLTWNEINPAEGVYDWKAMDGQIEKIAATPGVGFLVWIKSYNKMDTEDDPKQPDVPPWVAQKGKVKYLSNGAPAAWEPGCEYQKYFGQMVKALGQKYRDHPRLIGVDMRGLDCKWGEWCWRGELPALQEAESKTGLTPDTLRAWGLRFVDDFADAFKGREKKLVWPNSGDSFIWARGMKYDYGPASRDIWKRAVEKGCGGRDGMVEVWNGYMTEGYGQRLTDDGYLEVNEDFPPIKNGAVWYTENECYGRQGESFGPKESEPLRWFVSNMRTLQMRRNWVWPDVKAVDEMLPEFNRWVELSLGKTPETSADAWSWLREGYLPDWQKNRPVKNFERWLLQRDVKPDGVTVPEAKVDISKLGQEESGKGYELHARRTDGAHGNHCIYFKADRRFVSGGQRRMQVKVTYLDGPATKWCVEYTGAGGAARSAAVETAASGKWKTVTFEIPDMRFAAAFQGQMDFRIVSLGPGDATIKLVRLVKSQ